MKRRLAISSLISWLGLVALQAASHCVVCREPLPDSFYWVTSPSLPERQAVCRACAKLKSRCFICGLPVKTAFQELPDGRYLCLRDAKLAVFDQAIAEFIFARVKSDLHRMFHRTGKLPDANVKARLVDGYQLQKIQDQLTPPNSATRTLGTTQTKAWADGSFEHTIHLINGVGPARLAAIAAHEWTHAWLHENLPEHRQIAKATVEGFCELAAYRLMTERQEELEKLVILQNAYSEGQITLLAQTESKAQFLRLANWMLHDTAPSFNESNVTRLMTQSPSASFEQLWRPAVKTIVPDTLQLKGVSSGRQRRFALINNRTLAKGERAPVRVGEKTVLVHCLEIGANSALIQVAGETSPRKIFLK